MYDSISFLLANVRSYLPKKDLIEAVLDDSSADIAIFTESWLTANIDTRELLFEAFNATD